MRNLVILLGLILIVGSFCILSRDNVLAQDSKEVTIGSENGENNAEVPRVGLTDFIAGKIIRFAPLGTLLIYLFIAFIFVRCFGAFLYYTLWDLKRARSIKKEIKNVSDLETLVAKKSVISPLIKEVIERSREILNNQTLSEKLEETKEYVFVKLEGKLVSFNMGNHAPLLGFLGTVIGMIVTFEQVAKAPAGQFTPSDLANGISTALVTTALGLIVKLAVDFMRNNVTQQIDTLREDIFMFSQNIPQKMVQLTDK